MDANHNRGSRRQAVRFRPALTAAFRGPLLLILLLASGLRFYNLGAQSFWNDEGNTARLVERPIRLIIEGAAGDIHPPGYYLLLHVWRAIAGESEYALRAFSALCGVLTVATAAAIVMTAGSARTSRADHGPEGYRLSVLAAAALVAVHPLAVAYSQEARMYAQLGLASALTLWAALLLVRRDVRPPPSGPLLSGSRRRHLPATLSLAACIAFGLYTQYAYGLALVGLSLAFGLFWLTHRADRPDRPHGLDRTWRWPLLGRWVVAHALGGLLFAPWAPVALSATGWQPPDLAAGAPVLTALTHTLLVGTTLSEQIPPIAVVCVFLVAWWSLWISLRARPGSITRFAIWAALAMALIPPALIASAGLYRPAYLKFLVVSVVPLAVVLALPLRQREAPSATPTNRRLPTAVKQLAAAGLLVGLLLAQGRSLQHLYNDPSFRRDDYRGIAQMLRDNGQPGDAILLNAPNQWEVFTYYYRGSDHGDALPVYPAPYRPTVAEAESWANGIIADHPNARLFALFWGDLESDPNRAIERALARLAFKANETWITSVRLARYGTGPLPTSPSVEVAALLDDRIRLTGYDVAATPYHPGDCVTVTLFWQAHTIIEEPLKVFVHLVGGEAGGPIIAQADMEPQAGFLPTTAWQPGYGIVDRYGLLLPSDLAPGTYTLRVGMYRYSGERLPLTVSGVAVGDFLELGRVTVEAP